MIWIAGETQKVIDFENKFRFSELKLSMPTVADSLKMFYYQLIMQHIHKCPTCEETFNEHCQCPQSHCACKNGHHWHICLVHQKVISSDKNSDHKISPFICTCTETVRGKSANKVISEVR